MADMKEWHKIIKSTRDSARTLCELSAQLYELTSTLQKEAIKQQESNQDGPETPPNS